jgi:hypothetical protein
MKIMIMIMAKNRTKNVDRLVMVSIGLSAVARFSFPDQLARKLHAPPALTFQEKPNFPSESIMAVPKTVQGELLVLT